MSDWYQWGKDGLTLQLRVQPKASKDQWVGPHGDRYRLRITAPPVDGKANAHLIKLLASAFGVNRSSVELQSGETSRNKRFFIRNPSKVPIELPGIKKI